MTSQSCRKNRALNSEPQVNSMVPPIVCYSIIYMKQKYRVNPCFPPNKSDLCSLTCTTNCSGHDLPCPECFLWRSKGYPGPNYMALLTAEFCPYDHDSPLTCKRRISALALYVSEECLRGVRTRRSQQSPLTREQRNWALVFLVHVASIL